MAAVFTMIPFLWGGASSIILPWLRAVPWQIWAIVGALLAVLYYGHWKEARGVAKCELRIEQAAAKERLRQEGVRRLEGQKASQRADELEAKNTTLQSKVEEINNEYERLKKRNAELAAKAKGKATTGDGCGAPASITDRIRRLR